MFSTADSHDKIKLGKYIQKVLSIFINGVILKIDYLCVSLMESWY